MIESTATQTNTTQLTEPVVENNTEAVTPAFVNKSPATPKEPYSKPYPDRVTIKVCPFYIKGKCNHGASGRILHDGKTCKFSHPRKCLRYCRFGTDKYKGCAGSCDLFHPILCKNSLNYKQCLLPNCSFTHLKFTQRFKTPEPQFNHSNRTDHRYNQGSNIPLFRTPKPPLNNYNSFEQRLYSQPQQPLSNISMYHQSELPISHGTERNFAQLSSRKDDIQR